MHPLYVAVILLFFSSGFSGLIYEVVWERFLGQIFGHTVWSVSTVLATYMLGLALGSLLLGRKADRHPRPFALYGWLELGVGVYALLTPWLLQLVESGYLGFYRAYQPSQLVSVPVRFTLSLVALLLPTFFMGGTLPVISRFVIQRLNQIVANLGLLYAINTFGAAAGAAATGFLILPHLGLHRSLLLAAGLNMAIGLIAIVLGQRPAPPPPEEEPAGEVAATVPSEEAAAQPVDPALYWLLVLGFGLSGFAALSNEVAWTRLFAMLIGSSVYAFATVLTAFLIGLAAGSLVFAAWFGGRLMRASWFGWVEWLLGAACLGLIPVFNAMPSAVLSARSLVGDRYNELLLLEFILCLGVVVVPTLLMGMTFPLVTALLTRAARELGRTIGSVYFANTLGAILGSALTGFLLIPVLGLRPTLLLMAGLNVVVGAVILLHQARSFWRGLLRVGMMALWVVIAWNLPPWNRAALAAGVFMYHQSPKSLAAVEDVSAEPLPVEAAMKPSPGNRRRLLFYREGLSCTVSVFQSGEHLALAVNGKVDASTQPPDMFTQLFSGHLPMLLAEHPQRALVIGLGSGVTCKAIALHGIPHLDCVELEPAVAAGARYFARVNDRILENPGRVNLIFDDGRNYIQASPEPYDVIVSEPSNPWISGVANLFTAEFYGFCRDHLTPGGIFLQWCQLYSLSRDDFLMILNTFRQVFPQAMVWLSNSGDALLVGRVRDTPLDWPTLKEKLANPVLRSDLDYLHITSPEVLLSYYMLRLNDLNELLDGARVNTDDNLHLEFSAPRSLHLRDAIATNLAVLMEARTDPLPPLQGFDTGGLETATMQEQFAVSFNQRGLDELARAAYRRAVELDGASIPARLGAAWAEQQDGHPLAAWFHLDMAFRYAPDNPAVSAALARLYRDQGLLAQARQAAEWAASLAPENEEYQELREELRRTQGSKGSL